VNKGDAAEPTLNVSQSIHSDQSAHRSSEEAESMTPFNSKIGLRNQATKFLVRHHVSRDTRLAGEQAPHNMCQSLVTPEVAMIVNYDAAIIVPKLASHPT
jgi:hypothetical protein